MQVNYLDWLTKKLTKETRSTGRDKRLIYVKKVLEVNLNEDGLIEVRLEATKRKKVWLKKLRTVISTCNPKYCPLYYTCSSIPSPLKRYKCFGEFCNNLYNDYPYLAFQLATKFGITSINQVVPIKKNRISYNIKL